MKHQCRGDVRDMENALFEGMEWQKRHALVKSTIITSTVVVVLSTSSTAYVTSSYGFINRSGHQIYNWIDWIWESSRAGFQSLGLAASQVLRYSTPGNKVAESTYSPGWLNLLSTYPRCSSKMSSLMSNRNCLVGLGIQLLNTPLESLLTFSYFPSLPYPGD